MSPKSIDGVRRPSPPSQPARSLPKPDMRPDHTLPSPEPTPLLENTEKALPEAIPDEPLAGAGGLSSNKPRRFKKWLLVGLAIFFAIAVAVGIYAYSWYQQQLAPASTDTTKHVRVLIKQGSMPIAIADQLQAAGVIRSSFAFSIYTKLTGTENMLKAGAYNLQPSLSTPKIIEHLVEGKQDTYTVTFLPGGTLADGRKVLIKLGFTASEVDAAFAKTYDRPLFADKPAGADLEGYLYGETIEFDASATVESILERFFEEYEAVIKENDLVNKFKLQGLNLYEGITLASIVQRETSNPDSQVQVARVFLNRMEIGMALGSDVTYQYAADKMGVARDTKLDSPYNTRIHTGLPPGPIAVPGKSALLSVANPANNDYLFFLAGDDHQMHYAKTDAEHQQNIVRYCQKLCLIL